jgi:excisionase family DNA binding protein
MNQTGVRILTLCELADHLRLPRTWLRAEADAGRIPCLRAGRRLRFDPAAVELALLRRAAEGEVANGR